MVRRQVGSLLAGYLGASYGLGAWFRAMALSRKAVSSTARKTVYVLRIEDSASPRPFSSTIHASMWDGRSLSSGFAPILAPMMCVRAIVPYRFFVVAFRSDASSDKSIHSAVNSPRVILRSLASRLARSRARTSAVLSRASLAVLP